MSNPAPSTTYDTLPLSLLLPEIPITSTHLLSGGNTNSVHRCHASTGSSMIAKRFWTFSVSLGPSAFELSLKRSEVENLVLENIPKDLHRTVSVPKPLKFLHLRGNDTVETPNLADSTLLLSSDAGAHTITLKQLLLDSSSLSPSDSASLSPETWTHLGNALGEWLARLHWRFRLPAASSMVIDTGESGEVRNLHHDLAGIGAGNFELWYTVTYGRLSSSYESWQPTVVEKLQEIVTSAEAPSTSTENVGARTLVMGDFWTGNVLVSTKMGDDGHDMVSTPEMTVIDWELSRTGHAWQDLGQMAAELLLCHYFCPRSSSSSSSRALKVLTAFLSSYSCEWEALSGRKVFRLGKQSQKENNRQKNSRKEVDTELLVLIHAMVHCVVWPEFSGWGPEENVLQLKRDAAKVLTAVVEGTVGGVVEGLRGFEAVWEE